jgi:hypothetical protein
VVFLILGLASVSLAGYVIDADLSDWGVTPFSDWLPDSGTADYIQQDDVKNRPDIGGFREIYDFEALFFDDDADNLYFAVVTSNSWSNPYDAQMIGDLCLDFDGYSIGDLGIVTGLEYAIRLIVSTGEVLSGTTWQDTGYWTPDTLVYRQNSPWRARTGTVEGSATIAYNESVTEPPPYVLYNAPYDNTTIIEIAVSRSILPYLQPGDTVLSHITCYCGNDALNLTGIVDVPEPATIIFGLFGLGIVRKIYRKKVRGKN